MRNVMAVMVSVAAVWVVTTPASALAQEGPLQGRLSTTLETGWFFPGYADVRIPGDTGSSFSLTRDLSAASRPFVRGRLGLRISDRHSVSLLVAPLTFHSSGVLSRPIVFQGEVFAAGVPVESTFTFNSYRATWRYSVVKQESLEVAVGLTGKIRDAAIGMRGGGQASTKSNVGFVPLVSFRASWWFAGPFGLLLEGDALAAPQGRAEDVLIATQARVTAPLVLYCGYRFLEGGADNSEVYNFNLIHYAAVGASASF